MENLNCQIKPDWALTWERGILDAWSRQLVIKYGSINEAWNQMASKYDDDIVSSNRSKFIEKIEQHEPETILDIGAGTGVFAIPLAQNAKRVVAVEPSSGMLDILRKKAEEAGLSKIECINKRWEDTSIDELLDINEGMYDAVVCSHALYYITDLHQSFKKMNDVSKGHIHLFVLTDHASDAAYTKLWERLNNTPMPPYPDYSCLYMVLREIGMHPDIEMLDTYAKKCVTDMDELVDQWKDSLVQEGDLSDDERDAIREYLAGTIKEDGEGLSWEWRSLDAFIHWKT